MAQWIKCQLDTYEDLQVLIKVRHAWWPVSVTLALGIGDGDTDRQILQLAGQLV